MVKILRTILFLFVLCHSMVNAQDMHFTQFYANPLYLNPAFTGANACSRVGLTYRNQWPGIKKTYSSYMLSADHFLPHYNLGVGMLVANDVAGTGALKTTLINPSIAYEAKLSRDFGMRFGLQPGVTMKSINFNQLTFGDQLATGNSTSVESQKPNRVYFDMGAGILCYTSKFWGGLSIAHFNQSNESLLDNEDAIRPLKISIHTGAKFLINEDDKVMPLKSITPAIHYRHQQKFDQLDIGLYYGQGVINLGLWYRGIPVKRYLPNYPNHDAIAIILGAKTDRFNVGYSYDITISKLANVTSGAHELNISYQFCKLKKRKKRIEVACPKF